MSRAFLVSRFASLQLLALIQGHLRFRFSGVLVVDSDPLVSLAMSLTKARQCIVIAMLVGIAAAHAGMSSSHEEAYGFCEENHTFPVLEPKIGDELLTGLSELDMLLTGLSELDLDRATVTREFLTRGIDPSKMEIETDGSIDLTKMSAPEPFRRFTHSHAQNQSHGCSTLRPWPSARQGPSHTQSWGGSYRQEVIQLYEQLLGQLMPLRGASFFGESPPPTLVARVNQHFEELLNRPENDEFKFVGADRHQFRLSVYPTVTSRIIMELTNKCWEYTPEFTNSYKALPQDWNGDLPHEYVHFFEKYGIGQPDAVWFGDGPVIKVGIDNASGDLFNLTHKSNCSQPSPSAVSLSLWRVPDEEMGSKGKMYKAVAQYKYKGLRQQISTPAALAATTTTTTTASAMPLELNSGLQQKMPLEPNSGLQQKWAEIVKVLVLISGFASLLS